MKPNNYANGHKDISVKEEDSRFLQNTKSIIVVYKQQFIYLFN
jgi:hypothetical protein